ncbi:MAG: hypothetical protein HY744_01590 [Deltaproteobacteria bacterium]|nr:hypothetical protein [Deltaproteobacteria bacterium]
MGIGDVEMLNGWEPEELALRLRTLARVAARGKRSAGNVARFMVDVDCHCRQLAERLLRGEYRVGRGRTFWIEDPKPRLIFALPFADRVVQHLLIAETLPGLERRMAPQSFACRRGKGTHRALARASVLALRHAWVLRVDVKNSAASLA